MKTTILAALAVATIAPTLHAETFAISGIIGDRKGRTVLTTEPCDVKLDSFQIGSQKATLGNMRRAFYYTSTGETNEGCWRHDAGTVVLVWPTENIMRRWPIANFQLADRKVSAWESVR